jgi:hypothetical protein
VLAGKTINIQGKQMKITKTELKQLIKESIVDEKTKTKAEAQFDVYIELLDFTSMLCDLSEKLDGYFNGGSLEEENKLHFMFKSAEVAQAFTKRAQGLCSKIMKAKIKKSTY